MNVIVEFLDREPIENVITAMNFRLDRVIFFGYEDVKEEMENITRKFLVNYCGLTEDNVLFYSVPRTDMKEILTTIRQTVRKQKDEGNQVFFDITGGESLPLVAFGMLAAEFRAPVHQYDVSEGTLVELDEGAPIQISTSVQRRVLKPTVSMFIEMHGGVVNSRLHKGIKTIEDEETEQMAMAMWKICSENAKLWNQFTNLLKNYPADKTQMTATISLAQVRAAFEKNSLLKTPKQLITLLDKCEKVGLLKNVRHENGFFGYTFPNEGIRDCLRDSGAPLELYTYLTMRPNYTDTVLGVHLDWDGRIHTSIASDVVNEIDVMMMDGYVPVFVSCKNGNAGKEALYELRTVAERFGGKYARMILVCSAPLDGVDAERAEEMGIEQMQPI